MSEFFSPKLSALKPYVPGEQPQGREYVKLNTNESPYFPSAYSVDAITSEELNKLRLYSDPECNQLKNAIASFYGVKNTNVLPSNGSDEILAFAFAGLCNNGVCFPDITYGFYKVFASLFNISYEEVPLKEDFSIDIKDYFNKGKTVVLANPNAQTGIYLTLSEIEEVVKNNKNSVVIIDEAYIDFGGESAVKLIDKYKNLVVVQTFSKSRSLAGARVGFAIACEDLIADLNRVKYSFNPYNVNRLSILVASKAIEDKKYFEDCTKKIIEQRQKLNTELVARRFEVLPSLANFVLAKPLWTDGKTLYEKLKERGVLVRRFDDKRIDNYVRITIGSAEQMDMLLSAIDGIFKEIK